ncbi:glycoside hydrolase family 16 protein [Penicillium brevicompactum]|uniref:Glycoside hydrolase family 16 protein n=1 Tax=Penicillium brevicompactum TaxID=5074 RepID=A0A9W9RCR1_PENBR|nr:glycoside hydrolase family 16 protein [Penicillium brevicompactum]
MYSSYILAALPYLASALPSRELAKRDTTLIPTSCFDSTSSLTQYFSYGYPWGDTHNGAAIMKESNAVISTAGTLTLNATYTGGFGLRFTVEAGGGLDFSVDFIATVDKGTWPAFWLNGVNSWPPEIDIAEWKGSGDISFNTFNSSSEVEAKDVEYPSPTEFHAVKAELRDENGADVSVNFYLDGSLVTTQYAGGLVGEPLNLIIDLQMEGSSGTPGPTGTTLFQIKNLEVIDKNP